MLRLVLANLNRMRARVALTAIGVTVGTAAVVVLISLGVGLQTSTARSFSEFGDLTEITVLPAGAFSDLPGGGGGREREQPLDDKVLALWRALPHVVAVTPRVDLRGMAELKLGRQSTGASIQGIDPRVTDDLGWTLEGGAPRLGRGQIVLGQRVFENGDGGRVLVSQSGAASRPRSAAAAPTPSVRSLLGRQITLTLTRFDESGEESHRSERLRVAGVFEKSGGEKDYLVYMGQEDVEGFNEWLSGERTNRRAGYQNVLVRVDQRENVAAVVAAIRDAGFLTFSAQDALNSINQAFLVIQLILGGIGAVALVVAAIGIANTMTMAIYERTKEIGIMKALGATNRDVLKIFLTEAGTIGFLGGILGVLLGWLVSFVVDLFIRTQLAGPSAGGDGANEAIIVTPAWLMASALAFATGIGLFSGIYPALRAATLKPLQALRTE